MSQSTDQLQTVDENGFLLHELQIRLTCLVYIRFIGNVKYAATFWAFQKVDMSANFWISVLSTHVWNVFACTRVCAFMHVWWDSPPPPADTRCRALNCITQAWLTGTFWNSEGANLIVCSPHLPCNEEESRKYKELHQQMRCVMRLWMKGWRLWRTRWLSLSLFPSLQLNAHYCSVSALLVLETACQSNRVGRNDELLLFSLLSFRWGVFTFSHGSMTDLWRFDICSIITM